MKRHTWLSLKKIYLGSPEIFSLVTAWVDDADPSAFITRWDMRFFLDRLVQRAFRELTYGRETAGEEVLLFGASFYSRKGRKVHRGVMKQQLEMFRKHRECGQRPFRVNQTKEPQ